MKYPAAEAVIFNHVLSNDDVNEKETTVDEMSSHDDQNMDEISVGTDDFFIYTIFSHQTNSDKRHPKAKVGEALYRVLWVRKYSKDDTWEPVSYTHLTLPTILLV